MTKINVHLNEIRKIPNCDQLIQQEKCKASWQQKMGQYLTEEACANEFYKRMVGTENFKCRHCGSDQLEHRSGTRIIICVSCHKRSFFTTGTIFENAKLLRGWLGAILLFEEGVQFSAAFLAKIANVSYSTAWKVMTKLTEARSKESQFKIPVQPNVSKKVDAANSVESIIDPSTNGEAIMVELKREMQERLANSKKHREIIKTNVEHESGDDNKGGEVDNGDKKFEEDATQTKEQTGSGGKSLSNDPLGEITPQEEEIYQCLKENALDFDAIHQITEFSAKDIAIAVSALELRGMIGEVFGDNYKRCYAALKPTSKPGPALKPGLLASSKRSGFKDNKAQESSENVEKLVSALSNCIQELVSGTNKNTRKNVTLILIF